MGATHLGERLSKEKEVPDFRKLSRDGTLTQREEQVVHKEDSLW